MASLRPHRAVVTCEAALSGRPAVPRAVCTRAISTSAPARMGTKHLDWYYNSIRRQEELRTFVPPPPYPVEPLHGRKRARVFIDWQFGKVSPAANTTAEGGGGAGDSSSLPTQRVVIELADDIVPTTCKNFVNLCERPAGRGYVGVEVHQVRRGFGLLAGDFEAGDGRGSRCGLGGPGQGEEQEGGGGGAPRYFADENHIVRHSTPGVVTMASSGVHKNGSVFAILTAPQPQLDGRNVAFGRVLTGMDVITKISNVFAVNLRPAVPVVIKAAGVLPEPEWAAVDKQVAAEAKAAAAKVAAPAAGAGGKKAAASAAS